MKIGILTHPLGHNYGGNLQAYALQVVLQERGHDVEILNRIQRTNNLWRLASLAKGLVLYTIGKRDKIRGWLTEKEDDIIYGELKGFVREYIHLSKDLYSSKELGNYVTDNHFDACVVGSDQVWRKAYIPYMTDYFLKPIPDSVKKVSYAASFGVDTWQFTTEETEELKQLISKFSAVSVRENSAVELCREYLDIEAEWVLDPTMLLPKEHYEELISRKTTEAPKGSLMVFLLDPNSTKEELVAKVANDHDLKPFNVLPEISIPTLPGIRSISNNQKWPSVEQWLRNFRDSECVITDSFHGVVFSIIFNRPFLAIRNASRGMTRFNSLLNTFGIKDSVTNLSHPCHTYSFYKIDPNKRTQIFQSEQLKSLRFLASNAI